MLLLTTGPTFAADIAVNAILSSLVIMIVVTIPLYLCLLQPFIHDYIPGILKRMGLGMVLLLISGLCTLLMGILGHYNIVLTLALMTGQVTAQFL